MSAVAFDTLKFARKLEAGGFTQAQATAAAEAFADATSRELATKSDLAATKAELKADIELVKHDLKIFGSVMVVAVGVLLAAIRYLPAGHP